MIEQQTGTRKESISLTIICSSPERSSFAYSVGAARMEYRGLIRWLFLTCVAEAFA